MSTGVWLSVSIAALCLLLSAAFSASEAALNASSRARLMRMEKQGNRRARAALALMDERDRVGGALMVGKALLNVVAIALATGLSVACFGGVGVLYAAVLMSGLILVGCEILPRIVAGDQPERIALRVARPVGRAVRMLGPAQTGIEGLVRAALRPFGVRTDDNAQAVADESAGAITVEVLNRQGSDEKLDRDMMGGLLDLRNLAVSDVMIHRTDMVTVNAEEPPEEIVEAVLKAEFTRIPLWRGSPENIVGILHVKDLLRAIRNADGDLSRVDVPALVLPPWFVPDIRPLSEQLKAFRRRKTHFALVVDEYGEVEGLVTLEDILEEIVGDISDEHDVPVPGVQPQPDGSVSVEGSVPIRDLNRAMDWNLPDDEATTIAGLVIHEARSIPEADQSFTFHGFRFRVLRKERNRIAALRITPLVRKAAVAGG